jgi:hypothetical protein
MRKMGESQIIDFFSGYLKDAFQQRFGSNAPYSVGNFSGSQDRKFSDFFAGTDSKNILIEFKENKIEYKKEKIKPLRKKLCVKLDEKISILSRQCHFIGWGKDRIDTAVELNPYIDLVCRLWELKDFLRTPSDHQHDDFIDNFIDGGIGVSLEEFVRYIGHLNSIAGGTTDGSKAPFRSILYSRNDRGQLVGTRFESLGQLNKLKVIANRQSLSIGKESGSSGPGI